MEKEAIQAELKEVRAKIKEIRSNFSKKKQEKETQYSNGEDYSNQIKVFYDEIKEIEKLNNLDSINEDLELKKIKLSEYQSELDIIKEKFAKVKKVDVPFNDRPKIKTISSDKARSEIKALETKLQTQVLSLDKESELIKKISSLKKIVDSVSGDSSSNSTSNDEFKEVRKELNKVRKKYINTEKKIRSLYKQIRIISKDKKIKYKQIDALRELKKKSFEEFRLTKKDYSSLGKNLKSLFKQEEEILIKLGESPIQRKNKFRKDFKEKQKEVEEKLMKKGGILTTEDLLMFQKD